MSIILYSLKFIKEKNLKKYLLTIILASCFHMMALIYIPMYFICQIDWSKRKNAVLLFIAPVVGILVYLLIIKYTKYGNYIGSQYQGNQLLWHEIILSGAILVLATIERKHITINKEYFNVYYILQIITFIVAICSIILPAADRIVWLFYLQNIFLIPIIIKNIKQVDKKVLVLLLLLIILCVNVYAQAVVTDSYNIIPYKTIFQK